MNFKNYLEKLRALPDNQKKIIIWSIAVFFAVIMLIFWVNGFMKSIDKLSKEEINIDFTEAIDSQFQPK